MLRLRQRGLCFIVLAVFLLQPVGAYAQQAPTEKNIGVVTTLQGQATVGRQPLPQPLPLHFNDDVFFRDRITTPERSTVRLLLGGKGTLTIREQSQVTLDESVTPDGTRRSVVGLLVGKIGAAIARSLMRPGEVIEIQTPNAVAAVRGTVLIAEYVPPQGSARRAEPVLLASSAPGPLMAQQSGGAGGQSNFYVVSGEVTITAQGQSPVTVGTMQAVSVTSTATGIQVGAVQNVTPSQINDASQGLQTGKSHLGEAEAARTAQEQMQLAAALANAIVGSTTQPQTATQPPPAPTDNTVAPVQPENPTTPTSTENTLPTGPLLIVNNATLGMAEGASLATFNAGTANAITPLEISGGGTAVVTAPLLPVTGDTISHDGSIITLESGAGIVGASTDTTTPLVSMNGTELTNTGGPVFTLSGDSALTIFGPLLSLDSAAQAVLAGVMTVGDTSQVALGPASAVVIPSGTSLELTAPGFSLTGDSQLHTFAGEEGGGDLVSVSDGTLTLDSPLLSLSSGTPTASIAGDVLNVASTVTGPPSGNLVNVGAGSLTVAGDLVNLGAGSTLDLSGPVLGVSGGEVTVGNVLSLGAPLTTPSGQPVIQVNDGSLSTTDSLITLGADLTLGGALLAQSGGEVTTAGDALAVGSQTLTSGTTPVFDLTGGSLTTANDSHLVSVNGGTLNLGGPLLSLAMGPSEQTPTVNIAGDLLHVASTVTGPPSGALVSVEAGSLTAGGDLLNLGAGSILNLSGPLLGVSGGGVALGGAVLTATASTLNLSPAGPLLTLSNGASLTAGHLLELTDSPVDLGAQPLVSVSGGSTLTNNAGPVISVTGGSLTADALARSDGAGNTFNLTGSFLDLTDTSVTLRVFGDTPEASTDTFTHTLAAGEPAIRMTNSNLTLTGAGEPLVSFGVDSGAPISQGGVALIATHTTGTAKTLSLAGPLLSLGGVNLTDTNPQIQLSNMTVNQAEPNSLIEVSGLPVTIVGSLLQATDSALSTEGHLILIQDTSLTKGGAGALVTTDPTSVTTTADFFHIGSGGSLSLGGPLLTDVGGTFNIGQEFVQVAGSLSSSTSGPLLNFNGSTVNSGFGLLTSLSNPGTIHLAGPVVDATNTNITTGIDILILSNGAVLTSTSPDPLYQISGGSISTSLPFRIENGSTASLSGSLLAATGTTFTIGSSNFLNISGGSSLTTGAPILDLTDVNLSLSGPVANLSGGSTLTNTAGPVVKITGGSLTADALGVSDGTGNAFNLTGSFLDLTDTSVTLRVLGEVPTEGGDILIQTLAPGEPAIRMTNSNLTLTEPGVPLVSFLGDPEGVALIATNSSETPKTLSLAGPLLELGGVILTDPAPQIQLSNMTVTQTGPNSLIEVYGPTTLGGPLLSSDTSTITASGLLHVGDGSLLGQTSSPAFDLTGGALTIAGGGPAVAVNSSASFDGTLLQATSSSLTFEGPFLSLSSETTNLTVGGDMFNLAGTSTLTGPPSGSLVDAGAGSLTVAGDLVHLGAGSTLNLSGPVLAVNGGEVTVGSVLSLGAPLTTASGQPLLQVTQGSLSTSGSLAALGADLILQGAFLVQRGGEVTTGGDALPVGASTLTSGADPVFDFTGGTLTTTNGSHLVSLSGGTLNLGGPLLSLAMGPAEQVPTVNISGDVLHVASTVNGPASGSLVSVTAGNLNVTGDVANVTPGASLNLVGSSLVAVSGTGSVGVTGDVLNVAAAATVSNAAAAGPVIIVGPEGTLTAGGAFLNSSGSVSLNSPLLELAGGDTGSGSTALLQVPAGILTDTADLVNVSGTTTLGRSLLTVSGGDVAAGNVLNMETPLTTASGQPLFQVTQGSLSTSGSLATLGADLTLQGAFLAQSGGEVTTGADALAVGSHTLTSGATPVFDLTGGSLTTTNSSHLVSLNGGTLNLGGPLLQFAMGPEEQTPTVNIAGDVLHVASTVTGPPSGPLVSVEAGGLTAGGDLLNLGAGSTLNLSGPLLGVSGGSVALGGTALRADASTLNLSPSGPLLTLSNGASLTAGRVLDLTNVPLDLGAQPLVVLTGGSTLTNTAGPVVRITGGSLTADALGVSDGTGNAFNLTGSFLDLTDTSVTLRVLGEVPTEGGDILIQTLAPGEPAIRMTNSNLTLTEPGAPLVSFEGDPDGVALIAANTSGTPKTLSLAGPLLTLGTVTLTDTDPQIQLSNMNILQTGGNSLIVVDPGEMAALSGPLVGDAGSTFDLTAAGRFLSVRDGAGLNYTAALPLLQFMNSTINTNGSFFSLGSGPDQPGGTVSLAGPLLSAINSAFDSGPLSNFISVYDGATFTSTTGDPLLTLSGGSITTTGHVARIGLASDAFSDPTGSLGPVSATLQGPLLNATDAAITATYSVLNVRDNATFTSLTTAPLIQFLGTTPCSGETLCTSTLTLGGPDPDPTSPTFGQQINGRVFEVSPGLTAAFPVSAELAGPVLKAENTTIFTTDRILGVSSQPGASATLTSHTTDPLVQLTGGSVTMSGTYYPPTLNDSGKTEDTSGRFLSMASPSSDYPATFMLNGALLHAEGTTFYGQNHFLRLGSNAQVASTTPDPLVQFMGGSLTTDGIETFTPTFGSPSTTAFGDFTRVQGTGANLSLAGPLVYDSGAPFTLGGSVLQVRDGATLTYTSALTTPPALMQFSDSTVQMNGSVFQLRSAPATPGSSATLDGPVLMANNSSFDTGVNSNFFNVRDGATFTSTAADPLLQLTGSTITSSSVVVRFARSKDGSLSEAPVTATLGGPVLEATDSNIKAIWALLSIGDGTTIHSTGSAPLIQLGGDLGTTVTLGGIDPDPASSTFNQPTFPNVFEAVHRTSALAVADSSVEIAGPILSATNSDITTSGRVVGVFSATGASATIAKSTVSSTTLDPLVQLSGGKLKLAGTFLPTPVDGGTVTITSGSFLQMSSPTPAALATLTLQGPDAETPAGPLLSATGTTISTQNDFLSIGSNSHLVSSGTGALVQLTDSPLTIVGTQTFTPSEGSPSIFNFGNFLNVCCSNASVSLEGPLLAADPSPLTVAGSLVSISGGGQLVSTTTDPLITINGGTLTVGGPLLSLSNGASLTAGRVLDLTNVPLDLGAQPLVVLTGGSTLTNTAGPVVRITGGSLTADALGVSDGTGNAFNLTGSFLDLTDTSVTLRVLGEVPTEGGDILIQTLAPGEPAIRMTNSNLTLTEPGAPLVSFEGDPDGVALIAANTSGTPKTLSLAGPLLTLGTVTLTDTDPQIQLSSMNVVQTGTNGLIVGDPGETANLAGPLLQATDSAISSGGQVLDLSSGSPSLSSLPPAGTPAEPLLQLLRSPLTAQQIGTSSSSDTSTSDLYDYSTGSPVKIGTSTTVSTSSSASISGGGLLNLCCTEGTLSLAGPLLSATDSRITTGGGYGDGFLTLSSGVTFTGTGPTALIQLTRSPLTTLGTSTDDSTFTTTERNLNEVITGTYSSSYHTSSISGGGLLTLYGSGDPSKPTSMTLAGALLSAVDSPITTGSPVSSEGTFLHLSEASRFASTSPDPLIQLGGTNGSPLSTLSISTSISAYTDTTGTTTTYANTTTSGTFLELCCGTYDSSTETIVPTTLTLAGPLLSASNSPIQTGDFMIISSGGSLTVTGTAAPLIQLTNSPLTAQNTSTSTLETKNAAGNVLSSSSSSSNYGRFLELWGTLSLSGPLLNAANSPLTIAESLVSISGGGQLTSTTTDPLITLNGGTHTIGSATGPGTGSLLDLRGVNTDETGRGTDEVLNTGGRVIEVIGATLNLLGTGNAIRVDTAALTAGVSLLRALNGSVLTATTTLPLLQFMNSSVNTNGAFFRISSDPDEPESAATLAGPLLSAVNSALDSGSQDNHIVNVGDGATFTSATEDALLTSSGGSITTKNHVMRVGLTSNPADNTPTGSMDPVAVTLHGPALSATDTAITAANAVLAVKDRATFTSMTTMPLIQLQGTTCPEGAPCSATLTVGDSQTNGRVFEVQPSLTTPFPASAELWGPVLSATNTTVSTTDRILSVFGQTGASATLTSHTADPLVQLSGGSVTVGGDFLRMSSPDSAAPATLTLAGPLLSAANSPFTVAGRLVRILAGGQLTSTTTDPLITLNGGTHAIGSATGAAAGSLLDAHGVNTDSGIGGTGLGTDKVLQTGGTVFQATNSATVNLSGDGNAIRLDTALLEASAPIVNLINSTLNTTSSENSTGAMRLYQSSVTSTGPVFGLDHSTLTVQYGPLLNLTGGSNMTVNGDFASLINGSKIWVQHGPMINVDGVNANGTPSTLTVNGALVNFGATGGNQVVINNGFAPTTTLNGVPVNKDAASSITIGPNPIKNLGVGTPANAFNVTGSAIRATNGGVVNVTAPAP